MVSAYQEELWNRFDVIMKKQPNSIRQIWPDSGIGRSSFLTFFNKKKQLSYRTLNKIGLFIEHKEHELGIK